MSSALSRIGAWYDECLLHHPLLAKAGTAASIGVLGDLAAQYHEGRLRARKRWSPAGAGGAYPHSSRFRWTFKYDFRRGFANVANNLFLTAPIYHYGYEWLESLIPVNNGDDVVAVSLAALGQVLVDCVIFDALFVLLLFLCSTFIEGRTSSATRDLRSSLKKNLLPAITAIWKINVYAIPVEYALFRYFPLRMRVLGMSVIDLAWEAVTSYVIHDDGSTDDGVIRREQSYAGSDRSELSTSSGSTTPLPSPWSTPWSTPSSMEAEANATGGGEAELNVTRQPPSMPEGGGGGGEGDRGGGDKRKKS
eukprot:CAMPEP_0172565676 /NCGR_PEP_ID=MMETSP1067-20121228/109125_1 /TAXON_ID=265564 ORGANISM="Thalassiosira punctigera, Strain Tpunct2005C2" /NCGR_SAMPLE_ID=MMETSP1067 /ASSEMBLY_ACC=CAM_ASM_000444 /LENGTH=306 /DNA_ID=CAMNT_0013356617 /DNA_START=98 /DNA_END=1018 /DNA_ORIENTATION=+